MSHYDPIGRVDVEGLRLTRRGAPGGGVAGVADAHVAEQTVHVLRLEDVAHQAIVLAQVEPVAVAALLVCVEVDASELYRCMY